MVREIDLIELKKDGDLDLEIMQGTGIASIKELSMVVLNPDLSGITEHQRIVLSTVLHEKILDLDDHLKKLMKERYPKSK
jgi:hypothetical protein